MTTQGQDKDKKRRQDKLRQDDTRRDKTRQGNALNKTLDLLSNVVLPCDGFDRSCDWVVLFVFSCLVVSCRVVSWLGLAYLVWSGLVLTFVCRVVSCFILVRYRLG